MTQTRVTPAGLRNVQPLRVDANLFKPSKSQRRVLRKNEDLQIRVRTATLLGGEELREIQAGGRSGGFNEMGCGSLQ